MRVLHQKSVLVIAAVITFSGVSAPNAQTTQTQWTCFDFQRLPNDTWAPTRAVTITDGRASALLPANERFDPHAVYAGIRLGQLLDQQCAPLPPLL
jgi:hypothetical protein